MISSIDFSNIAKLIETLIELNVNPLSWVNEGCDLNVFNGNETPNNLCDEWVDNRCDLFWADGYLQSLSNITGYSRRSIVELYIDQRVNGQSENCFIPLISVRVHDISNDNKYILNNVKDCKNEMDRSMYIHMATSQNQDDSLVTCGMYVFEYLPSGSSDNEMLKQN